MLKTILRIILRLNYDCLMDYRAAGVGVFLQRERGYRGGAAGRRPLPLRLLPQHQRRRAEDQKLFLAETHSYKRLLRTILKATVPVLRLTNDVADS